MKELPIVAACRNAAQVHDSVLTGQLIDEERECVRPEVWLLSIVSTREGFSRSSRRPE
jgi:hypothetical protein